MFDPKRHPICLLIVAVFIAACSKDASDDAGDFGADTGLLGYVPADTPYLLATTGSLPDEVYEKLEPQLDASLRMYPAFIRDLVQAMIEEDDGADVEALQAAMPLIGELDDLMSVEGLRNAGIDRNSEYAFYGVGLLPVMRIGLSDGDLMESAVARLEESASKPMPVATIDGHDYRYFADDELQLLIAILNEELVMAIVPPEPSDEHLRTVLGLRPPASSIGQTSLLREIGEEYGFGEFMIGFFDVEKTVAVFLEEPSGINADILSMLTFDQAAISAECKDDARSIAALMPRVVLGYTGISAEALSSSAIFELRPDIAEGISRITGPVPGLGGKSEGIFSFGMSTNLLAAREFYAERLDALEQDPYRCASLAEVQAGIDAGRAALEQPVPPIVYGFNGFLAVVENIQGLDIQRQQPPTSIDMRLLIAMENAEGLLAMGAMFSPELASLDIEPNGEPVQLQIGQLAAMGQTVHIAMTDSAVALSLGEGPEARLGDMLAAAIKSPSPFMTVDMDAARYYSFIGAAMTADPEAPSGARDAMQEMVQAASEVLSRMSMSVDFTEQGIAVNSTVTLAD